MPYYQGERISKPNSEGGTIVQFIALEADSKKEAKGYMQAYFEAYDNVPSRKPSLITGVRTIRIHNVNIFTDSGDTWLD